MDGEGHHRRQLRVLLDHLRGKQRLAAEGIGFTDDEVGLGFVRPADLLLELPPHLLGRLGIVRHVDAGVADVAGDQRAMLLGDFFGDFERLPVDLLEILLPSDDAQLLAMRIVGERLDDVRAGMDELAMKLGDQVRMLKHDFRHEGPGLQVATPLELEQIALGADHRPGGKPFEESQILTFLCRRHRSFSLPLDGRIATLRRFARPRHASSAGTRGRSRRRKKRRERTC